MGQCAADRSAYLDSLRLRRGCAETISQSARATQKRRNSLHIRRTQSTYWRHNPCCFARKQLPFAPVTMCWHPL